MLIACIECGHKVSDKAIACPNCGYPINVAPKKEAPLKTASTRVRRWRKLPNGYGTIRNLGGRRRKPYAVYPPTIEYTDEGLPVARKALGYFETYQQAFECLVAYNSKPCDTNTDDITFEELYKIYYAHKFENSKRQFSDSAKGVTQSAFKNLSALHKKRYRDIKTLDYQRIIDESPLKHASLELMSSLIKQMNRFAMQNDYTDKDYAQFVRINIPDDDEKGVPFSDDELKIMWGNKENPVIQTALILIYTGMRVSELKGASIDAYNGVIKGGVKTTAGKNRVIPIHTAIKPFVEVFNQDDYSAVNFRRDLKNALKQLGIDKSDKGTVRTPHDCRHTFSWLCDKYGVDSLSKHLIMGHSLNSADVEVTVYGHRTFEELKAEIDKIECVF